ncbi:hypothetical protein A3J43_03190 [Candidatus Uhrbacteria bacterium RIFCSPHIGHO2_12_FULL_54_23]|uniref:Polymerase nucleotidyl transferase domain-containing protein n=2 Tax=Candidatus Uhriibacteriota TaxID=1752732 RepID=A0A1F7ULW0_9BACT|nr:MAG: hypothetical protein A3J43_03190 [Candidatus Uhrbacteria bacterium RIFCSPHIGHO2_12_FULL_54_23]OGL90710.1 MAG: hypothetical protein A3J36_02545 [Candidatus Uhrbacteria bacterium RIFCSPLOWO2_02_FULL_54_37]
MDRTTVNLQPIIEEYVGDLSRTIAIDGIFLFGSYARGDVRKDSDVDLIVLSEDFSDMNFIERMILLSRARGKGMLEFPADIIGYTPEEFADIEKDSVIMRQAKKEGRFVWKRNNNGA